MNLSFFELFCLYHIDAPGHSPSDSQWDGFLFSFCYIKRHFVLGYYPTIEELCDQIEEIAIFFNLQTFIGLGAGLGMFSYSYDHQTIVSSKGALVLMNYSIKYESISNKLKGF